MMIVKYSIFILLWKIEQIIIQHIHHINQGTNMMSRSVNKNNNSTTSYNCNRLQLNSTSLLKVQNSANQLMANNFTKIQSQFLKINQEIALLRHNSCRIIQRINQIDPYAEEIMQYVNNVAENQSNQPANSLGKEQQSLEGSQQNIYNELENMQEQAALDQINRQALTYNQTINQNSTKKGRNDITNIKQNKSLMKIGCENGISKINVRLELGQEQSETAIQIRQNIDKISELNVNPMHKNRRQPQSRQSQVSIVHKTLMRQQNPRVLTRVHGNSINTTNNVLQAQNSKSVGSQSMAMVREFIKDLETRVSSLQSQKVHHSTQIQTLQKQNQIFKRMLSIKSNKSKKRESKNNKRTHNNHIENQKYVSQKQSKQQEVLLNNQIVGGDYQQISKTENNENVQENNIINHLSKQFQELREYVKQKMVFCDGALDRCFNNVIQNKQNIQQVKQYANALNNKVGQIEADTKDVIEKLTAEKEKLLEKTRISDNDQYSRWKNTATILGYNKNKTSASQTNNVNNSINGILNLNQQSIISNKNYYQDKIVEIFEQMDRIRYDYYNLIKKLQAEHNQTESSTSTKGEGDNQINKLKSIAEKICLISSPVQEKLKKQINTLKKQCKKIRQQVSEIMGDMNNNGSGQTRTLVIKANQNKQDWKQITTKIYKLRQQLLAHVKDLQAKININNDMTVVIQQLQVGLSQCKILNGKKVNIVDFQKSCKRIETRLNNFIRQVCQKQGIANEQEALIAKQPWFCLSCDSEIKNFTSKLGKSIYNEKLAGKKVNPQSHMIRRVESKLPSVH